MKWIAIIALLIAVVAILTLGLVIKTGVSCPPNLDDMTTDGGGLQATNANLCIILSNQTHKEISFGAVLDGSIDFGSVLIRDQHFGNAYLKTSVNSGLHSLAITICGRPAITNTLTFSTTSTTTNTIYINILGDKKTKYRFELKQSTKPLGII